MQQNTHLHSLDWSGILRSCGILLLACLLWQTVAGTAQAGPRTTSLKNTVHAVASSYHTSATSPRAPAQPAGSALLRELRAFPPKTVKIVLTGGLFILIGALCIPYMLSGSAAPPFSWLEHAVNVSRALVPAPQHSLAGASAVARMQTVPLFQRPAPSRRPGTRPKPAYPQPGDRVLASTPKRKRQPSSEVTLVETFFQQSGFVVQGGSETTFIMTSQLPRYKRYGNISVHIVKKTVVDHRHIQAIRKQHHRAAPSQHAMAFMIVDSDVTESAYQAIYQAQKAENFTIIPLSHLLVAKSVRHASCAQQLEEKMSAASGNSNLYAMNTPVADPLNFFGRTKIMNQLLNAVGQQQHLAVFGAPKIGKTWLFWQLKERLSAHITIYVDLQQLPKSCSYLYRKIIDECVRDIGFKYPNVKLPPLQLSWTGTTDNDDEKFISDMLTIWQRVQPIQSQTQIILLLDGAEHLLPGATARREHGGSSQPNTDLPAFMTTVQRLAATQPCVTTMLAFAAPQALRTPFPKTWRCERKIALSALTEEQCNGMITALGAQMGLRFSEETLSRLYYETGGHPYVTRQVCSLIAKNLRRSKMIPATPAQTDEGIAVQVRDVEAAVREYVDYKSDYLEEFWRQLRPAEQDVLRRLVSQESCTRAELVQQIQESGALNQQQQVLQCLTANDVVEHCEGKYAIKMGLFERIVMMQQERVL